MISRKLCSPLNRAIVALKLTDAFPPVEGEYIGCDRGTLFLLDQGCKVRHAIGDFDSVSTEEMQRIMDSGAELTILPRIKDDTDSEAAIRFCLEKGYEEIWLIGGTGGRIDHLVINLRLAEKYPGQVVLWDRGNKVHACTKGRYAFPYRPDCYMSFFTSSHAEISLEGMKYPLHKRTIKPDDLYTVSNEITAQEGILTVHEGIVTVMECLDQ